MSLAKLMSPGDRLNAITRMVERPTDIQSVIQQIRLSRLKLGSASDRLEHFEPDSNALALLSDHTVNVTLEIDILVETIQQLTSV